MVTVADIDKWNVDVLQHLFDTVDSSGKALTTLGENLDTVNQSLQDWGGQTAEEYRADHGKTRTDIDAQHAETEQMKKVVGQAITDVKGVTDELAGIRNAATDLNAYISPEDKIVSSRHLPENNADNQRKIGELQQRLDALLKHATDVDAETAAAIKAAIAPKADTPGGDQPGGKKPTDNASGPVGGLDGNPPYANGATATTAPAAHTVPLADNPPGYDQNMGPGAQRDQAWKDYLNGKNSDGTQRPYGTFPAALPKPEAVSDPALRTIGAAGRQQGVSYAWGANKSVDGPSQGHNATDEELRQMHTDREHDGSWQYNDKDRTGFDCGGLTRFAVHQGYGNDVDIGPGTHHQWEQLGGAAGQIGDPGPGDLIFWGPQAADHTAINLGNGVLIQSSSSGHGIGLATIEQMNTSEGGKPIFMHPH